MASRFAGAGSRVGTLAGQRGPGFDAVIDPIDGFVDAPRRRSLVAADVEKLAELARKFRVAIVLAANVSPVAMLRSNRPRGMAGINAMTTIARTVWMIVRDLDVANRQRV
jgi:hypothetical protein